MESGVINQIHRGWETEEQVGQQSRGVDVAENGFWASALES